MQTASLRIDHFNEVLDRLPPGLDLDVLAVETKAVERWREIKDGASLLRLALARGPGGLSLSQTAGWAGMIGVAGLSAPGLKYRLDLAGDFLDALVSRLLAGAAHSTPFHWPGRCLRAADGSGISEHASQGVDWRVHGVFDLGRGRFSHLQLSDRHGAESMARGAPVDGEIRIGDRGFARAGVLQEWCKQGGSADFIVRMSWRTFALTTPQGEPFNISDHLATLPDTAEPHEVMVLAKTGPQKPPLTLRLIIGRKPPKATEAARHKLRRHATRQQKTLDPRTLAAAEFLVLATSLPAERYRACDIGAAYRLRWQIELAFKRLKSLLHIDQIPTRTTQASRSWLLAHLVLALLCDDVSPQVLDAFPSAPQ